MKISPRRSSWEIAMMAGLLANAVARPLVMVLDQAFVLPGLIFTLIPLILAALVWTRNRWLIALVTAVSAVSLLGALSEPLVQSRLANFEATGYFIVALMQVVGLTLTTVAGLVVTVQEFLTRQPCSDNRS